MTSSPAASAARSRAQIFLCFLKARNILCACDLISRSRRMSSFSLDLLRGVTSFSGA